MIARPKGASAGARIAMGAILISATAVQVLPPVDRLRSRIPIGAGSDSDALVTPWTMRTAASNMANGPRNLYKANIFWPRGDGLAFSDGLLAYAPIHSLLRRIAGDNLAYTAVVFGAYLLGAAALYLLLRFFQVSPWASFLGTIVFATLPYRSAEVIHIQLSGAFVLLLGLLFVFRWLDTFQARDAIAIGVSIGVLWTISTYLAISLVLSMIAIGITWVFRRSVRPTINRRFFVTAIVGLITTILCLAPTIRAYLVIQQTGLLKRPVAQIIRVRIFQLVPSSLYQLFGRRRWYPAGSDALLPSPLVLFLFRAFRRCTSQRLATRQKAWRLNVVYAGFTTRSRQS